jgi:hypothetical protein
MKKTILFSIILVLVLAASGIGFSITFNRINSIQTDLQTAKNTIDEQTRTLNNNQITISDLSSQIEEKDRYSDNLTESLAATKSLLDNATAELSIAANEMDNLEIDISGYKNGLNNTRLQLDYAHDKLKLFEDTYGDVNSGILPSGSISSGTIKNIRRSFNLKRNPEAVNPSYDQLLSFLRSDKTDQKLYVEGLYTCGNFAEDVFNNAEAKGIRTAIVCINFEDDYAGHALNAFKTTDRGLIFIDCTGDKVRTNYRMVKKANLKIGDIYECEPVFSSDYYFLPMGEVNEVIIYW